MLFCSGFIEKSTSVHGLVFIIKRRYWLVQFIHLYIFLQYGLTALHFLAVCYFGEISLTGIGSNVTQGNVELCGFNQFYAICGDVLSANDAKVVCRQLGFTQCMLYTSNNASILMN